MQKYAEIRRSAGMSVADNPSATLEASKLGLPPRAAAIRRADTPSDTPNLGAALAATFGRVLTQAESHCSATLRLEHSVNTCHAVIMRVDRDKILSLALITLAEHVELAGDGPIRPSPALRLALAVAFSFSKDGDEGPFHDFWRQALDNRKGWSDTMDNSHRTTMLMTQLRGVLRAVGLEPCNATELPLLQAARKTLPPRAARRFNPLTQRMTATHNESDQQADVAASSEPE